jgi:hypothetical protein
MRNLLFSVSGQELSCQNAGMLASSSAEYLDAVFAFSEEWEGLMKTAVFFGEQDDSVYSVLLDGNACKVPSEVLLGCAFHVGVFGVKADARVTSTVIRLILYPGSYKEGVTPPEPSPDVYAQILDRLSELSAASVPPGGAAGQVLAKNSASDYDTGWADAGGGGGDVSFPAFTNEPFQTIIDMTNTFATSSFWAGSTGFEITYSQAPSVYSEWHDASQTSVFKHFPVSAEHPDGRLEVHWIGRRAGQFYVEDHLLLESDGFPATYAMGGPVEFRGRDGFSAGFDAAGITVTCGAYTSPRSDDVAMIASAATKAEYRQIQGMAEVHINGYNWDPDTKYFVGDQVNTAWWQSFIATADNQGELPDEASAFWETEPESCAIGETYSPWGESVVVNGYGWYPKIELELTQEDHDMMAQAPREAVAVNDNRWMKMTGWPEYGRYSVLYHGDGTSHWLKSFEEMDLVDVHDQPFSKMKEITGSDGMFVFLGHNSMWRFHDLADFDFSQLESPYVEFASATLDNRWTVDKDSQDLWVEQADSPLGRVYLIQGGTAAVDEVVAAVEKTTFVLSKNFEGITDGDLAYLSQFVSFTRTHTSIDAIRDAIYYLLCSAAAGIQRQEDKNDIQDVAIQNKIENVRMGGLLLGKYQDGSPDIPAASSLGEAPNPDFLGWFKDLADMRDAKAIDNSVRTDDEGNEHVSEFGFNIASGKVITGKNWGAGADIPMANSEVQTREAAAGTGTSYTEFRFTGMPNNLANDSFIYWLMREPVFASGTGLVITRSDIDSNLAEAQVGSLFFVRPFNGGCQVYFRPYGTSSSLMCYSHGVAPNTGLQPAWEAVHNGVEIKWVPDEALWLDNKITFSHRVSHTDARTDAVKTNWNNVTVEKCSFVDAMVGWRWEDSDANTGDPGYPRHIASDLGSDGYLESRTLTAIEGAIAATKALPPDFAKGSLLNGVVTSWNDMGSAFLESGWNTRYYNYDKSKVLVYRKAEGDWAITVTLSEADGDGEPGATIQAYTLVDSAGDWVFPRLDFDVAFRMNLTEGFYYDPDWESGEPWADTRIVDRLSVGLQEAADAAFAGNGLAAYAAGLGEFLDGTKATKIGNAPHPLEFLGDMPVGYIYRNFVNASGDNPSYLMIELMNYPATFNTVLDEFFYVFETENTNRTWQCLMGVKASSMTQWGPAGSSYPPNIEGYGGDAGTGYYIQYIAYSKTAAGVPTDPSQLFAYYKSQSSWSGANVGFQYVYVVPGSGYPSGEPMWQMSGSLNASRLSGGNTAIQMGMFNVQEPMKLVYKTGATPFDVPVFTYSAGWDMPDIGGWTDLPEWAATKAVQYYDPENGDYSIETVLPQGYTDFEFGFTTIGQKPIASLPGTDYNGDMLAIGGQKQFNFGMNPEGDGGYGGDSQSTSYVFNVGDSNVDKQILSYHRPFWYDGKTQSRHWLAMRDDPAPAQNLPPATYSGEGFVNGQTISVSLRENGADTFSYRYGLRLYLSISLADPSYSGPYKIDLADYQGWVVCGVGGDDGFLTIPLKSLGLYEFVYTEWGQWRYLNHSSAETIPAPVMYDHTFTEEFGDTTIYASAGAEVVLSCKNIYGNGNWTVNLNVLTPDDDARITGTIIQYTGPNGGWSSYQQLVATDDAATYPGVWLSYVDTGKWDGHDDWRFTLNAVPKDNAAKVVQLFGVASCHESGSSPGHPETVIHMAILEF